MADPRVANTFGIILDQAVTALHQLRRLESQSKLSGKAFVRTALEIAGCDGARLTKVDELLTAADWARSAQALVRNLVRAFGQPQFPCPFPKPKLAKMVGVFGTEAAMGELNQLHISLGEAQALASMRAMAAFPEKFGRIQSFEQHQERVTDARAAFDAACERLRTGWSAAEVEITNSDLPESMRKDGLFKVRFRDHPATNLGSPHWPQELAEAVLVQQGIAEPKAKPAPRKAKTVTKPVIARRRLLVRDVAEADTR